MGGSLPGPWAPWEFVGSTSLLASGSVASAAKFPAGVRSGDLVVAIMSPLNEGSGTTMSAPGWDHWAKGTQDYVCTARYEEGLPPPVYTRAGVNSSFISVLVFRALGWSTVKLQAHVSPAASISVTTKSQNELLIAIGVTPKTTRPWVVSMNGANPVARVERNNAPAMQVYSANVEYPRQVSEIRVDAPSGAERNLILTVS